MYIFAIATRAYLRDVSESPDLSVSCCWIATRAYLRDVSNAHMRKPSSDAIAARA